MCSSDLAIRQAEIEHDGIVTAFAQCIARGGAAGHATDRVPGLDQALLQQGTELALVFDNQDFHVAFRLAR